MSITRIKNSSIVNNTPKYNRILAGLPYTPIIGTATDGGTGTTVSVAFTGNNVANGTITYTALSSPGSFTGTGTASPITVSGLSSGTAYTFSVKAANSLGDSAYSTASNSVTPVTPTSYESIATVTVGSGGSSSITFSSIPSTYKHLQVRVLCSDSGTNPDFNLKMRFNSDSGNNYARHLLSGNGSAVSSSGAGGDNFIGLPYFSNDSQIFGASVTDILDYADTNKYKTARSLGGIDKNGSGYAMLRSGAWLSTSAITSITFTSDATSASFRQYSSFALYGIKGA